MVQACVKDYAKKEALETEIINAAKENGLSLVNLVAYSGGRAEWLGCNIKVFGVGEEVTSNFEEREFTTDLTANDTSKNDTIIGLLMLNCAIAVKFHDEKTVEVFQE